MAEAEQIVPLISVLLYAACSRLMMYGFIDEFNFFKAARYSIARILFGSAITGTASGKSLANAFARAAG